MYQVWWISPRGFANEGKYIYGPEDACDKATDPVWNSVDGRLHHISSHRTLEAARRRAERGARNASRGHREWGELDAISVREVK